MDTIFNKTGCFYRALDDEPIFVLLARDPCFAETIRGWETSRQALIGRGEKPQGDHPMLLEALATATAGVAWRNESTDPTNGYDAGEHARWHVETAPERELVLSGRNPGDNGGTILPYDEWQKVRERAMPLGNRFLLAYMNNELVFWENRSYRRPGSPEDWTGYYKVNNSLQREMLENAYDDWLNQTRKTVSAIKKLTGRSEAPWYAETLRRAIEMGTEGKANRLLSKTLLNFDNDDLVVVHKSTLIAAMDAARGDTQYFEHTPDGGRRKITPMSFTRISEFLDYATAYGEFDENTPNGTRSPMSGEPMNEYRRNAIVIYKRVLGMLPEDYVSGSPSTATATSSAGKIDPAKEALWIDMAEERGFLSAEDAEKARAALPEGTKAAIPSKHLTFMVRDLAKKIATGLRQVTTDMTEWVESKNPKFLTTGSGQKMMAFVDRINGYAAELETGEADAARFRSRPIRMHPALGMPYEPQGDPYKRFADSHAELTVEDARAIVDRFRKRFPDLLRTYEDAKEAVPADVYFGVEGGNFYDAITNIGMGVPFWNEWRDRKDEFPQKVHDEISIPRGYPHLFPMPPQVQGRWTGGKINPSLYAKEVIEGIGKGFGKPYEEVAADYLHAAGVTEEAPLTAHIDFETRSSVPLKAESDTIDVTDVPEMPPHRFTIFTKARGWAYGRGLEINPAHIPDMLDRMEKDGWHLHAVFGGTVADKVGMLFKRVDPPADFNKAWEWLGSWCGKGLWVAGGLQPHRLEQLRKRIQGDDPVFPVRAMPPSVAEMMAAPTEGIDDADTDHGADDSWRGRGQEP